MEVQLQEEKLTEKERLLIDNLGYFDMELERFKELFGIPSNAEAAIALGKKPKNAKQDGYYIKTNGNKIRFDVATNKPTVLTNPRVKS